MPRASERESSEKLQISVLTFLMTGGGFALVTLVFVLLLNPSSRSEADDLSRRYKDLIALLSSPDMKSLRTQAELSKGQENTKSLREIVGDTLGKYGLDFKSFPAAKLVTQGKSGLEEIHQQIDLKPAKLGSILSFVSAVKEAKKTIQVENVTLNREVRGKDEDMWTASATFADYTSK
jgi:hypothetical protein